MGSPKHNSGASAPPSVVITPSSLQPAFVEEKKEKAHPSEWSVDDVVEWLKGKGFDQDVCNKFTGAFPTYLDSRS